MRKGVRPVSAGSQPMPAFWVRPKRSPLGAVEQGLGADRERSRGPFASGADRPGSASLSTSAIPGVRLVTFTRDPPFGRMPSHPGPPSRCYSLHPPPATNGVAIDSRFASAPSPKPNRRERARMSVDDKSLARMAQKLRRHLARDPRRRRAPGTPPRCMSCAEIVSVLFFDEMRFDPKDPSGPRPTCSSSPRATPRRSCGRRSRKRARSTTTS